MRKVLTSEQSAQLPALSQGPGFGPGVGFGPKGRLAPDGHERPIRPLVTLECGPEIFLPAVQAQ
jgi:hypothetical protein